MYAADSSSFIAYFGGLPGDDVAAIDRALTSGRLVLTPVALTELLSQPGLPTAHRAHILELPTLEIAAGYWLRVAGLRSALLGRGLKARLADALIAQSCIDHDVPLITRDRDFRHFAEHCGLKLA